MNASTAPVLVSVDEGIASIRFNRPQALNAIDAAMARALRDGVREVVATPEVRVIVLSGEGRAFMAGGDLQAFHADLPHAPATAHRIIDPLHEAVAVLAEATSPVVASVHGAVAGAGLSLTMGCDLAIASDDAKFVPAYARIGASLDGGGSWALPRLVGLKRAMEMVLLSETLDATTALQLGIVNRVVPASQLQAETLALARRLAQGPTQTFGRIKRLLRASLQRPLRDQLDAERDAFATCAASSDFAEGLAAFFDKRPAQFIGK